MGLFDDMRAKLADERGASFLLALLMFVICSVVAAMVVMSASVNVEHVKQQTSEEQAYLTLSSASQLLEDSLVAENMEFQGVGSGSDVTSVTLQCTSPTALTDRVAKAAEQALKGAASSYSGTFTVEAADMDDVTCSMKIKSNYDITLVLTSTSEDYSYSMTLVMTASVGEGSLGTDITTVTWPQDGMHITRGDVKAETTP